MVPLNLERALCRRRGLDRFDEDARPLVAGKRRSPHGDDHQLALPQRADHRIAGLRKSSRELDELVAKSLNRDPAARPPTAEAFADQLARLPEAWTQAQVRQQMETWFDFDRLSEDAMLATPAPLPLTSPPPTVVLRPSQHLSVMRWALGALVAALSVGLWLWNRDALEPAAVTPKVAQPLPAMAMPPAAESALVVAPMAPAGPPPASKPTRGKAKLQVKSAPPESPAASTPKPEARDPLLESPYR